MVLMGAVGASFSMYTSTKIYASWLCTYIKHGSVTESDSSLQLIHSLSCSFFFLVSNESGTDIADAARQARRGKAKMGVQSVFQTPFFFPSLFFLVLVHMCSG